MKIVLQIMYLSLIQIISLRIQIQWAIETIRLH